LQREWDQQEDQRPAGRPANNQIFHHSFEALGLWCRNSENSTAGIYRFLALKWVMTMGQSAKEDLDVHLFSLVFMTQSCCMTHSCMTCMCDLCRVNSSTGVKSKFANTDTDTDTDTDTNTHTRTHVHCDTHTDCHTVTHTYTHTRTRAQTHTHAHAHTHTHTHKQIHTHTHIHTMMKIWLKSA